MENIKRPEVCLKHSHIVRPVAKTSTNLTKHLAEELHHVNAESALAVEQAFDALTDAEALMVATQEQASIAKAAATAIHTGNVPNHGDEQLVQVAKRTKALSDVLQRDISVEQEQMQDLAEVLAYQVEKTKSNYQRSVKRAEYLFGRFMAHGKGDIAAVSKSSTHAHPPASWAPFDLDWEYSKGTRVLRGEEKQFPREDIDIDTLRATMVSDVCAKTIAQHERANQANEARAKAQSEAARIEQDELEAAALTAEIKGA